MSLKGQVKLVKPYTYLEREGIGRTKQISGASIKKNMQVTMGKEKHISVAKPVSNYPPIITHTEFSPRDVSRDKTVSNHLQHSHRDQMQQRQVKPVNKQSLQREIANTLRKNRCRGKSQTC